MLLSSDQTDTDIQSYYNAQPSYTLFSPLLGESGTKHLLFLVVLLCLSVPGLTTNPETTIQRINYGIMFEKSYNIFMGQENWLHTFQIPLPRKNPSQRSVLQHAPMQNSGSYHQNHKPAPSRMHGQRQHHCGANSPSHSNNNITSTKNILPIFKVKKRTL